MNPDIQEVVALLEIAEKCNGHSGKLSNLQAWAIGELTAINAEIKAAAIESAKAAAPVEPQAPGESEPHDDDEVIHTADNPNPNLADRRRV